LVNQSSEVRLGCVFEGVRIRIRIRIRTRIRTRIRIRIRTRTRTRIRTRIRIRIRIRTRRLEAWGYTNKAHLRGLNKIS
jgi:hypothetical protein